MLAELKAGEEKGAEHVFRNLALYLSPPVTAFDGSGAPLATLRAALEPGAAEKYDQLGINGARLADAVLAELPYKGASPHDPARVLIGSAEFETPAKHVDAIFSKLFASAPLAHFIVQ